MYMAAIGSYIIGLLKIQNHDFNLFFYSKHV